jgi:hypothetical protein
MATEKPLEVASGPKVPKPNYEAASHKKPVVNADTPQAEASSQGGGPGEVLTRPKAGRTLESRGSRK